MDGFLGGEERRKTGWMRAEAAGDPGSWRQQAILGRGRWDAEALRDIVRNYAPEMLADPDAVLVFDETGFLKQGKASYGVGRQYTGSSGKITNCQIEVFVSYVFRHGHAFIDRALYLPKARTDDRGRLAAVHVPVSFVATDRVYGVGDIEMALKRTTKGYAPGVNANHLFRLCGKPLAVAGTAKDIAATLPEGCLATAVGSRGKQGCEIA